MRRYDANLFFSMFWGRTDVYGGLPKLHDLSFLLNQIKNKGCNEDKYYDYADICHLMACQ